MRSSTKNMERKHGPMLFSHTPDTYFSRNVCLETEIADRSEFDGAAFVFLLHLPRRLTFYMHTSIVPVYVTPISAGN